LERDAWLRGLDREQFSSFVQNMLQREDKDTEYGSNEAIQLKIVSQAVLFVMFFLLDDGLLGLGLWNFAAPRPRVSRRDKTSITSGVSRRRGIPAMSKPR